jgi:hypothetical protein
MKPMMSNQFPGRAHHVIVTAFGSTANQILKTLRTREIMFGYDAMGVTHKCPKSTVNKDLQDISLGQGEVFGAVIGDPESRRSAERSGRIWMSPRGYDEDPGIAGTDAGAGGITRNGCILFALNEERVGDQFVSCLRRCQDYQQQVPSLGKNSTEQLVTQVYVIASLSGGTGSGTLVRAIAMVAEKAAALKILVRITPIVILMGTLNPGDRCTSARNHQLALRSLQTHFEGRFKPLSSSNGDFQMVCDAPLLISNATAFGEIADLKRVITLVGHMLYLHIHMTIGPIVYQEGINLMSFDTQDR